jgi:hypothetical protein
MEVEVKVKDRFYKIGNLVDIENNRCLSSALVNLNEYILINFCSELCASVVMGNGSAVNQPRFFL